MRIPPWRFRPMVSYTIMITGGGVLFECLLSEACVTIVSIFREESVKLLLL